MSLTGDGPLRVTVVHSFYSSRQPSGENVVVDLQVGALRRAGHHVTLVARSTDELEQHRSYPARAAYRAATGLGDSPLTEINDSRPDLVHVHNLFPNLGRRWIERLDVPMVATLHNYRPLCPAGTLLREGRECTLCPDAGSARAAVRHSCFKGSRLQTLPVAIGTRFAADPVLQRARRIITLNDAMRTTYAGYGVPVERLTTIPNFVLPGHAEPSQREPHWIFIGRLSVEKGIIELLRHWPADRRLLIVGTGPEEERAQQLAGPSVTFLGQLPHDKVTPLLAGAAGLVFPSLWPEGLPTVYLEALAAGLPVLAWPQSIVGTLVDREGTGIVTTGPRLEADLERADRLFPTLTDRCRTVYAQTYSEQAWVTSMTAAYRAVLA